MLWINSWQYHLKISYFSFLTKTKYKYLKYSKVINIWQKEIWRTQNSNLISNLILPLRRNNQPLNVLPKTVYTETNIHSSPFLLTAVPTIYTCTHLHINSTEHYFKSLLLYVSTCGHTCSAHRWQSEDNTGIGSLLPLLHGFWDSNSSCQACPLNPKCKQFLLVDRQTHRQSECMCTREGWGRETVWTGTALSSHCSWTQFLRLAWQVLHPMNTCWPFNTISIFLKKIDCYYF